MTLYMNRSYNHNALLLNSEYATTQPGSSELRSLFSKIKIPNFIADFTAL